MWHILTPTYTNYIPDKGVITPLSEICRMMCDVYKEACFKQNKTKQKKKKLTNELKMG